MSAVSSQVAIAPSRRWDAIDVARGIAIAAMVIYHFGWDLSFLKLIETNVIQMPAWRWFARIIAGSFLFLSGIGLASAHARGFRWQPYLKRLAKVGGAALLITVATFFAFPDSYIFFGILHCIALSSILALPFLRAPWAATVAVAGFVLVAPHIFTDPALDQPWLDWLGLGTFDPVTNDYVPIFPWFGLVLLGIAFGNTVLVPAQRTPIAAWQASGRGSRLLVWAGRKSLPIYLIHQIVLLGLLYGVLQITGPNPVAEARPFAVECEASCRQQNAQPSTCRAICACAVQNNRQSDLWRKILSDDIDDGDRTRISRMMQQCLRQTPQVQP